MSNNIIRVKKDTNFVVMNKSALQDKSLSWKAKGIIAYMLSMPDDWTFYIEELVNHATDGIASFRSGFNELRRSGYVKRERVQGEDGQFSWETIVYEKPHTDSPHVEKPSMEKPSMDNRTLLSINELNNDSLSIDDIYISQFDELWKLYPNKKSKDRAFKSFRNHMKKGGNFQSVKEGLLAYVEYCKANDWYKPAHGSTWFNNKRWEDDYSQDKRGANNESNSKPKNHYNGINF